MYSINTSGMKSARSFFECAMLYHDTDKPRGALWQDNERPLDGSRKHHMRLVKHSDSRYACTLYDTELVTYHKDGMVVVRTDDSVSSRKFMWNVLPKGIQAWSFRRRTMISLHNKSADPHWLLGKHLVFKQNGVGDWALLNQPEQRVREYLNKDKALAIKRQIRPFMKWHGAASKVAQFYLRANHHLTADDYTSMLDDRDQWGVLAQYMHSPKTFREKLYNLYGARELRDIPNTVRPKFGKLPQSS
jgi:hypothetical protein